jgi:hypothetical protein
MWLERSIRFCTRTASLRTTFSAAEVPRDDKHQQGAGFASAPNGVAHRMMFSAVPRSAETKEDAPKVKSTWKGRNRVWEEATDFSACSIPSMIPR